MLLFENRRVLITGSRPAASAKVILRRFAEGGARVFSLARSQELDQDRLDKIHDAADGCGRTNGINLDKRPVVSNRPSFG